VSEVYFSDDKAARAMKRKAGIIKLFMLKRMRLPKNIQPVGFPPVALTLPRAVKRIADELAPEKIILFGSYAYGTPTPDSDVDLLVIMRTRQKTKDRYLTVGRLLRPRQFPVDIIVKTPKEVEQALKNKRNFFIRDIVTRGKVLYER
jgi:predicted nucleotidyltransferase